jgi:hypothetical protein
MFGAGACHDERALRLAGTERDERAEQNPQALSTERQHPYKEAS